MNTEEYISSGVIEAYVLGLASLEEARILECIAKNNSAVQQAFEETQEALENVAILEQSQELPKGLDDKIWDKIEKEDRAEEKQFEPFVVLPKPPEEPFVASKANTWKYLCAAASVLLLCTLGVLFFQMQAYSKVENSFVRLEQESKNTSLAYEQLQQKWSIASSPNMTLVSLSGTENNPSNKAVVYWDKPKGTVYLSAENLPAPAENQQYQLWAIVDGKPVNAGLYDSKGIQKMLQISSAQAFAITLEKTGGSPAPTMQNLLVMGKVG